MIKGETKSQDARAIGGDRKCGGMRQGRNEKKAGWPRLLPAKSVCLRGLFLRLGVYSGGEIHLFG
jgi:hypothetical protein